MADKKQTQNLEILQRGEKIDKELFFTKSTYEHLIDASWKKIQEINEEDSLKSSIYYGLYYYSFTGLIRSGPLCERVMGKDGFPEISVYVGETQYLLRESILNSLFGEHAESIVSPWRDAWKDGLYSYVEDIGENSQVIGSANIDVKSIQKKYNEDILQLKKQNTETIRQKEEEKANALNAQKEKYETEIENLKMSSSSIDNTEIVNELKKKHQDEIATLKVQYQTKVDELYTKYKTSLDKKNKNISNLQSSLSAKTSDYDAYREKAEKELNEHKKYVYDPNYDHYYSDVLPKIVNAIEFTHTDIIIRSSLIALSLAGMVLSCIYFL